MLRFDEQFGSARKCLMNRSLRFCPRYCSQYFMRAHDAQLCALPGTRRPDAAVASDARSDRARPTGRHARRAPSPYATNVSSGTTSPSVAHDQCLVVHGEPLGGHGEPLRRAGQLPRRARLTHPSCTTNPPSRATNPSAVHDQPLVAHDQFLVMHDQFLVVLDRAARRA